MKFSNVNSNIFQESEYDNDDAFLKSNAAVDSNIINVVDNFLSRFIFVSKYQGHNQVNLKLSLATLPKKLTLDNFHIVQMINFEKVQMALVAFQNQKSDQLFNYYDQRSRARIHQLSNHAGETQDLSKELLTFSLATKNKLVKLFKLEREFKKIEHKRRQEKDVIRINIQQHPDVKRSDNTVTTEKTISLFPVVEESEYGEYDLTQSRQNQEFIVPRTRGTGNGDLLSQFSSPDKQIADTSNVRRSKSQQSKSMYGQSMEYSIEMSQEESATYSGSSFSSFSDVIKEETESNLSSDRDKSI